MSLNVTLPWCLVPLRLYRVLSRDGGRAHRLPRAVPGCSRSRVSQVPPVEAGNAIGLRICQACGGREELSIDVEHGEEVR